MTAIGFRPSAVGSQVLLGVVGKAFCARLTFTFPLLLKPDRRAEDWNNIRRCDDFPNCCITPPVSSVNI